MKIYKIECGVLLEKNHEDFNSYNTVYDKKNAYFDENVSIKETLGDAKDIAKYYVENGVNGTYAVISEFEISNDYTLEELEENYIDILGYECYSVENIVYSLFKVKNSKYRYPNTDGRIIENFVGKDILEEIKDEN